MLACVFLLVLGLLFVPGIERIFFDVLRDRGFVAGQKIEGCRVVLRQVDGAGWTLHLQITFEHRDDRIDASHPGNARAGKRSVSLPRPKLIDRPSACQVVDVRLSGAERQRGNAAAGVAQRKRSEFQRTLGVMRKVLPSSNSISARPSSLVASFMPRPSAC